jgi:hypothetical protein
LYVFLQPDGVGDTLLPAFGGACVKISDQVCGVKKACMNILLKVVDRVNAGVDLLEVCIVCERILVGDENRAFIYHHV